MRKNILTKCLPFVAAVILAASCSKDDNNGGSSVIPQPSPTEDVVLPDPNPNPDPTPDAPKTVMVPFSVKVDDGTSLSKIAYASKTTNGKNGEVITREFESTDCGEIKMTVTGEDVTQTDIALTSDVVNGETIYCFAGLIPVTESREQDFKDGKIELTGTFKYSGKEDNQGFSTTLLLDLEENHCNHVFKAEFASNAESITFVDQNAYLCFTVCEYQTSFTLSFNDDETLRKFVPNDAHQIWIAVPCGDNGKPTVKGALISRVEKELKPGTVYKVNRTDKYEEDGVVFVNLGTTGFTPDGTPCSLWWAETNIGATNPWESGDYFAWGETVPYYKVGHAYDDPCSSWREIEGRTINGYNWATYSGFDGDENGSNFSKYHDNESSTLAEDDDVAYQTNNDWRMPTATEFANLIDKCHWVRTDNYNGSGKSGYIVYKKSVESNHEYNYQSDTHIFLPAAGYRYDSRISSVGYYWASSLYLDSPSDAFALRFYSDRVSANYIGNRCYGRPIRAVRCMMKPVDGKKYDVIFESEKETQL